ncbi:MAG TPA: 3-dehydroquinate synthase [Phycisphaerales bacterium]|nr:3-dehydroquinate synthase [Phycisphaerales bacterium]
MTTRILHLGSATCPIHVHPNLLADAPAIIKSLGCFTRIFIAADSAILSTHAQTLASALTSAGITPYIHAITAEESRKTFEQSSTLINFLLDHHCSRADLLIALGGGLLCDLAAFTASIFHRGIKLLLAPTTLLAMVDASIGGKTALNYPLPDHSLGKNILGTFYPPLAIIADPLTLTTLPLQVFRAGLAECVKHALLADPAHFTSLRENAAKILSQDPQTLSHLISTSITIKSAIVEQDPLEHSIRAHLNLGHTFAHAIELIPQLNLSHGYAVSIGLCAAAELSRLSAHLSPTHVASIQQLLASFNLPTRLPASIPLSQLLTNMAHDKKSSHARLRFILLRDIAQPFISDNVSPDHLRSALLFIGASE